ncbi:hypothetical protein [Sporosarcina sp. G11-34]|nr:hypothetical protein [Sporosarcina sp. G11-34]MCZ2257521.1 hypothetical protein [Sporosarcina sp. G11-34]
MRKGGHLEKELTFRAKEWTTGKRADNPEREVDMYATRITNKKVASL